MNGKEELKIKIEGEKGYVVLGRTLSTQDTREVRKAFEKLEQQNISDILVDMSNVYQIDSSGVGVLVMYLKKMKENKGSLKLISPKEEVKRILRLVNLYSYFEIIE